MQDISEPSGTAESEPSFCSSCGALATGPYCSTCGQALTTPGHLPSPETLDTSTTEQVEFGFFEGRSPFTYLAAVALIITAIYLAFFRPDNSTHTVIGTMTVSSSEFYGKNDGDFCTGEGGYSDIQFGTSVTVTNEAGKVIGTAILGEGSVETNTCVFNFSVDDVNSADYYSIEVGRRGKLTYSNEEFESRDWTASATLGD